MLLFVELFKGQAVHPGSYCADSQMLSRKSISAEAAYDKAIVTEIHSANLGCGIQGCTFILFLDDNDLVCL